jgi:glycosyltransferase involved in cell wall biosynthesis
VSSPAVSVILPTYNRLPYLRQAVESVLAQTCTDWELIIADDGSDEQTRAYLRSCESLPRVIVMLLPRMGNPGAVRNVALREAHGEFIAFLDSDDLWMPTKLELQLAVLRASTDCQWSYTDHIRINHAGDSINSQRNPRRVLHAGHIFEHLMRLRVGVAMPTVMVRRQLLERVGGFDEQQGLHEDHQMWLRLSLMSKICVLTEPLTCIRRHREHFGSDGIPSFQARRRVLEKIYSLPMSPRDRSIFRTERARNDAVLALAFAAAGDGAAVWRTFAESWRYSWRSAIWYAVGARAVARLLAPAWLVSLVRRSREYRQHTARLP